MHSFFHRNWGFSLGLIQYLTNLMQKIKGKQQWTQEEKKMLADLFPKFSSKKWKMISTQMAMRGFKRTQLECREKWINFLDPNLNNDDWNQEELQRLYNFHDKYGTRWCFMQKELNRTQNRIKNRFYGTIRNYLRFVMNTLCQRHTCFNNQINKISPSLLNDLYNSENVFDFLRGQIKKMIYRMKFKIDKKTLRNRIRQKENLYRELLGLIGSLFKGSFSLKFFDQIEKSEYDQDEKEPLDIESIKQAPEKVFGIQLKNLKTQFQQRIQEHQNQPDIQGSLESVSVSLSVVSNDRVCQKVDLDSQNKENIKQLQHLYATTIIQKPDDQNDLQKMKNQIIPSQPKNQNQFYPFISQEQQSMLIHLEWMMNRYGGLHQLHLDYEMMIERIRCQNLMMMQQQQQLIINQLVDRMRQNGNQVHQNIN